eukprot:511822-Pleurochrysis_carterae.AAC.5
MLDIVLFRADQGGDPELVRESQRRRYQDPAVVDKVIEYDSQWRTTRGTLDDAKKEKNATQKKIGEFHKKKEVRDGHRGRVTGICTSVSSIVRVHHQEQAGALQNVLTHSPLSSRAQYVYHPGSMYDGSWFSGGARRASRREKGARDAHRRARGEGAHVHSMLKQGGGHSLLRTVASMGMDVFSLHSGARQA